MRAVWAAGTAVEAGRADRLRITGLVEPRATGTGTRARRDASRRPSGKTDISTAIVREVRVVGGRGVEAKVPGDAMMPTEEMGAGMTATEIGIETGDVMIGIGEMIGIGTGGDDVKS